MTAGRDLHDIHIVLYIISQWPDLALVTRNYVAHRMRLLYIAPEFWTNFQPVAPKAARQGPSQSRGRSSTRRGRGKGS
jgi:hypothetical protein